MSGYHPAACGKQLRSTAPPCEVPHTFKASAHSLKCLHALQLGWKELGPPLCSALCRNRQAGRMHKVTGRVRLRVKVTVKVEVRIRIRVISFSCHPGKGSPGRGYSAPPLDLG